MTTAIAMRDVSVRFGRLRAVDAVNLDVEQGGCVGIVGESGSGKTTLMRAVLGLQRLASGTIAIDGLAADASLRQRARHVQAIFQDPASSLSPRRTIRQSFDEVGELLGEPRSALYRRLDALLQRLALRPDVVDKYPYQLSGGQARRVALARALLVRPRILIADEPTAGLDVSVQGDLLNLLQEMRVEGGLTLVVITHNLAVARLIVDTAAVMRHGQVLETGPAGQLFENPQTDYMRQLLQAWPRLNLRATARPALPARSGQ